MAMKRRSFRRHYGARRYRKLFIIAVEGEKTEPQYFNHIRSKSSTVCIKCLNSKHKSSAQQVLRRMNTHLKENSLYEGDEAWLVVDKDSNTDDRLSELYDWSIKQNNFNFALSNPKFEFWLLLHFEDGNGITSSRDCSERLKRYLPNYNKSIEAHKITHQQISDAVQRAQQRDCPPCKDWPRTCGGTTVYKLIKNIRHADEPA